MPDESFDPATEWYAAFQRVCALVEAADEEALRRHVPATPAWTCLDLLAHMIGLDHDTLAGDEPDDHDDAWTQGHVDQRRGRSAAELLAEWRGEADAVVTYVREQDPRPLGDAIIHEQDLRGALGVPGGRHTAGLAAIRDRMAGRLATAVDDLGASPLRLEATDGDWTWRSADGEPGAVLRAPAYDLARAVTARRTADQLRSWVVAGDVGPYLGAFATVGPLPEQPLPE